MPAGSTSPEGPRGSLPNDELPDELPDELGIRLGQALHTQAAAPVDVPALLAGSRRRARQVRSRRIGLGTAGVVLVIGLPVGAELLHAPDGSAPSAVLSSGAPGSPGPLGTMITTRPVPSPRHGATPAGPLTGSSAGGTPSAGEPGPAGRSISDALAFVAADLPAAVALRAGGQDLLLPLVNGQQCRDPAPGEALPADGRLWTWNGPAQTGSTGLRITLTVTSWAAGQGAGAFSELVTGTGRCSFAAPQQGRTGSLSPGVQTWSATSATDGASYSREVVRLGDLIAGVEVRDDESASAQRLAGSLSSVLAERLAAAG